MSCGCFLVNPSYGRIKFRFCPIFWDQLDCNITFELLHAPRSQNQRYTRHGQGFPTVPNMAWFTASCESATGHTCKISLLRCFTRWYATSFIATALSIYGVIEADVYSQDQSLFLAQCLWVKRYINRKTPHQI